MEETNLKHLIVYPGQTVLLITKHSYPPSEMDKLSDKITEAIPNIPFLIIDGEQFEVAVVDDRRIESYVPEFMNDDP